MGFPNLVQGAAGGAGSMPGLAALRQAPESFDAIRRWPRRFDLMSGASTASDGQIVNALERGIAEHRVVLLYVADRPAPSSHAVARAAAAPAPGLRTVGSQAGDAAIRGMSATDRVLEALGKGLRQLGPEFRDIVEQFLEPENLLKTAGFFVAAAAVGLAAHTNPISAVVFDGAMIAFVYYSAGRAGVEALVVLYSATARASNASTTAEIDSAARDYARAIIGLGGAVFLGWLARHLRFRARARAQRPEAPAALPPARTVPRTGTAPPPQGRGVWDLNPFDRGREIERRLGQNLPGNFPTIDRFQNGVATSIKSLDLQAPTYQSATTLQRTLNGYVDSVANFQGRNWAGVTIRARDITARALDLAVPGAGTAAQQAAINQAVAYGASRGVTVNVIPFP